MRNLTYILHFFLCLFLLITIATTHAQNGPQALFDQANKQLESGEYRQAISLYQQLEKQNQWSGALFINLGISYQRIDSLGKAKFYYLRATHFEETESQAQQALTFIDDQFSHQSATLPKLPWDVATDWLKQHIGAIPLVAAGLILFNIGILIFIARWFFRGIPSLTKQVSLGILGLAFLVTITGFYTQYVADRYHKAVMVTDQAQVIENPQNQEAMVSQAFEGYTFTVDKDKSKDHPNWSYVRMSNGLYGWIPTKEIMIL